MQKHSRAVAGIAMLLALLFVQIGCREKAADRPSPNVLLVSIDSLRADHLGVYGYSRDTSPALDRFASQGVRFENALAPAPWTLPSHVSLFTGLPPIAHGVLFDPKALADDALCLAEVLRANGYATAGFVGGPFLRSIYGLAQGFDTYDDRTVVRPLLESHRGQSSPELVALTIDWIEKHTEAVEPRPFFVFLHLWDVHYDYSPPPPYDEMFDPDYTGSITSQDFETGDQVHADMDPRDLEHIVALYDGEIRYTDAHLANLLDHLDRKGLADDTIVVITSDHGEEFFEHGEKGHRKNLHGETLRVPLMMRYPGRMPAGAVSPSIARLEDVPTTILALAGIERPALFGAPSAPADLSDPSNLADLTARDLSRDFSDNGETRPARSAFGDLHGAEASIQRDRMKLIWSRKAGVARTQLFDLARDPDEQSELAAERETRVELFDRLARWRADWQTQPSHAVDIELDEAQLNALRSLGYIR